MTFFLSSRGGSSAPSLDAKNNVGEAETLFALASERVRGRSTKKTIVANLPFLSLRERTEVRITG